MLLTIDIGNTNLTLGLYEGAKLGARWRLSTDPERMPDEYGLQILGVLQHSGCSPKQLDGICLSSVVPPVTGRVIQACKQYLDLEPLVVSSELKTGIKILYENPSAVGPDRIADAVATKELYGCPAIVIDYGTATTFNAITRDAEYLGGAIAPGMNIALEALIMRTSKLPTIDLQIPPSVIGRNTIHAIQSGMLYGYASMVEGMVKRFRAILGEDAKVIATGGLSEVIAQSTDVFTDIAPWLTLDGLRILWEMNQPS
ncbi:MAG: type III pantothenate kinase [Anaerolineaceae bacterium]|nr:type III pantothenate kinase [Anaerolineaceae bacterium]